MSEARVKISVVDGTLEIEGSEAFVSEQLEKFREAITSGLGRSRHRGQAAASSASAEDSADDGDDGNDANEVPDDLSEVFAISQSGAGVQILKDIPGDSTPLKTTNAAKLLLFGVNKLKQKETVLFEDVRSVCKAHGFYSQKNMARYLKDDKSSFVFGGSGKKQNLTLTKPGTNQAAKLVKQLSAGSGK